MCCLNKRYHKHTIRESRFKTVGCFLTESMPDTASTACYEAAHATPEQLHPVGHGL
jgi:hypothetical protein